MRFTQIILGTFFIESLRFRKKKYVGKKELDESEKGKDKQQQVTSTMKRPWWCPFCFSFEVLKTHFRLLFSCRSKETTRNEYQED